MLSIIQQWLHKGILIFLFIAVIGYGVIFSLLSITRHEHFSSQGWDLGLYEQIIWKYSQGKIPMSSLTNKLDLADRFRPTMLLAVPFYKIWPDTKMLLILQAGLIAASAIPIFLLARQKARDYLFSLLIAASSILFVGSQSLIMNDFHELAFLPVLLSLMFLFLEQRKWKAYFLTVILALGVREYVGFIIGAIGISLLFMKVPRKVALITCALGLVWSLTVILIIMPHFGQNSYQGFLGGEQKFNQELTYLVTHPGYLLFNFFQPAVKLKTLFVSFVSFGFLPLLFPPLLLPIIVQFLMRFLDLAHPYRWTYYFQYSADLAVLLAVAAIYAKPRLEKLVDVVMLNLPACRQGRFQHLINLVGSKRAGFVINLLLLISLIATQIFISTPIKLLLHKEFFQPQPYMVNNNEMLKNIPPNASVATQNSLAAHLGNRDQISILPEVNNAEYIAIDLHPNQDLFNFFGRSYNEMQNILNYQQKNGYTQIFHQGDAYLLKKVSK